LKNHTDFSDEVSDSFESNHEYTILYSAKPKKAKKVLSIIVVLALAIASITAYVQIRHLMNTPSRMTIVYPGIQLNTLSSESTTLKSDSLKIYSSGGKLFMTTVSVSEHPSEWDVLIAKNNPDATVVKPESLTQTVYNIPTEVLDYNQNEMSVSLSFALASAFDYLKIPYQSSLDLADVTLHMQDGTVLKESTVTLLQLGDEKIKNFKQVQDYMFKIKDASPVNLKIRLTNGKEYEVTVKPSWSKTLNRYALGFYALPRFKFPASYKFNAKNVSGGSGGLMLALAAVEELTPQQIVPNVNIGGTGAISSGGEVQEIAGLKQKMITGHNNGNKYFLIPKSMCGQVKTHFKDMTVIPVSNLTEAVEQLKNISQGKTLTSCNK
jgi:PDZ domain-containing secreted protein